MSAGNGPLSGVARTATVHSGLYLAAGAVTLLSGLVNVAVLTRELSPGEFGRLAILLVAGSLLTVLLNLGTLQGTMALVYGSVDGEDAGTPEAASTDPRRALTTGLAMTASLGALAISGTAVLSGSIADWLLDDPSAGDLVVIAATGAAVTALWRLSANVLRLERRPTHYLAATAALGFLQVVALLTLLAVEPGLRGALIALTAGAAMACVPTFLLVRHLITTRVSIADARQILQRGRVMTPAVVAISIIQMADLLVLSRYAGATEVAIYRVASRIGALASYWTSAMNMAWGALSRDPAHADAEREEGALSVAAFVADYFTFATIGAVLGLTLFSDEITRLVAPGYSEAAPLVPLLASAFALHGFFVVLYRTQRFREKRGWFIALVVLAAVVFLVCALLLAPRYEGYGVAVSSLLAWAVAIAGMGWRARLAPERPAYAVRSWLLALLLAVVLAGAAELGGSAVGRSIEIGLDVAALTAYPVLLRAFDLVPQFRRPQFGS